ncbi:hypothetical protein ElyMa_005304700 [Elysia marginata]|uniref:Uncharacterized protein n=1 Tax=Elysia marginata TaxID=1093978 RepID=A0AAV4K3N2_9GAST|nr:hypothetical protein ElyMa_005304700 [Elysia marginata]
MFVPFGAKKKQKMPNGFVDGFNLFESESNSYNVDDGDDSVDDDDDDDDGGGGDDDDDDHDDDDDDDDDDDNTCQSLESDYTPSASSRTNVDPETNSYKKTERPVAGRPHLRKLKRILFFLARNTELD